jgi:hypothetical protein
MMHSFAWIARAMRRSSPRDEEGQVESFVLALVIFLLILLVSGHRIVVQ